MARTPVMHALAYNVIAFSFSFLSLTLFSLAVTVATVTHLVVAAIDLCLVTHHCSLLVAAQQAGRHG